MTLEERDKIPAAKTSEFFRSRSTLPVILAHGAIRFFAHRGIEKPTRVKFPLPPNRTGKWCHSQVESYFSPRMNAN
jgi:hypothetical protein